MQTIPKNDRARIKEIFDAAYQCVVYNPSNGFSGELTAINNAKNALFFKPTSKMRQNTVGNYTVKVNSKLWYDVFCA